MTRAVVLGAGFGGLCAAAALRRSVDEVVLLERDRIPTAPAPRPGVPQSSQLHNLLSAAQIHAEDLLPGFLERVVGSGAVRARVSSDTYVHELGLRMPERDLGLAIVCARRPVIEQVARDLLLEDDRVRIRDEVVATGLSVTGGAVRGVLVRPAGGTRSEELAVDLVVDAMGTGSAVTRWLGEAGHTVPTEVRPVDHWYTTAVYRRPRTLRGSSRFWLVFATPPNSRGGLVSPVDDEFLDVSLNGRAADVPPRTHSEFAEFAASLEDPAIGELLARCRPVDGPVLFRVRNTVWHHFERMEHPVAGLLPVGDAVANLNPLFGQGMSVAAMQAASLAQHCRDLGGHDPAVLTGRHLRSAAEATRMAWELGASVDPSAGDRPVSDPADIAAFGRLLYANESVHRTYVKIWHLLEPASAVDSSEVVAEAVRRAAPLASGRTVE